MTVDYQVLEFKSATPIQEVGIFDRAPLTLDIRGANFKEVMEVRINGIRSPEFIVLTQRRILAQVPRSQRSAAVGSVTVISAKERLSQKAVISFTAAVSSGAVAEGPVRLVQNFLKLLFTTPGSDIFAPNQGGGLLKLIGSIGEAATLKARSTLSVGNTQTQMIRIQAQDPRLASSEKLKSARLLLAEFEPQAATLSLRIRLTAVDGSTADANVVL